MSVFLYTATCVLYSDPLRNICRESNSAEVGSKMVEQSVKLVYGKYSEACTDGRFAGIQALSGTGACRLFAEFQRRFHPNSHIYLPDLTWSKYVIFHPWQILAVKFKSFPPFFHPKIKKIKIFVSIIEIAILCFVQPSQNLERCPSSREKLPLL